jgi:hypothetical protein
MFYGSDSVDTAVKEIVNREAKDEIISIGVFRNRRNFRIIDLTSLPFISMFDQDKSELYHITLFLRKFSRAIAKRVSKSDSNGHIDYVPTQIITEYFRYLYSSERGLKIDGIKYNSSVHQEGTCYVLFFNLDDCTDDDDDEGDEALIFETDSITEMPVTDVEEEDHNFFA